ncbi:terminase small subunit [Thioalkalivibrio sulfidiphilus]|uniref:terminase small subunit n=1 Tax=Thioalkalivibrio sulfidiphilus TaxID=1033854 RepID=UPI00036E1D2C|nr:terminase small subunit [Thioalkalivibrio sulfidiphilus]
MIVNKKQLSDILGVSERTLTDWQREGLPMVLNAGRGGSNQYDTAQVIEWQIQRALAGEKRETARERRDRLEGDLLEIKLAKDAGNLVAVADIEPVWSGAILAARAEFRAWADRLRAEIDSRYGLETDAEIYAAAVDATLSKLSEQPPENDDSDETLDLADLEEEAGDE